MFQIHRIRHLADKTEQETVYGITSLGAEEADAERLQGLVRGHWGWRTGYTGCETRCWGRTVAGCAAAQLLAALRNAVVHLLETVTAASKAAATRSFAVHPHRAFPLVTGEYQEN